tara:strand:- start:1649 stop:2068 length:420 start_codon:yes stop_codon:yes gene_type:complete
VTIFDWINNILVYRKSWDSFSDSEHKTFNSFMINRFLSMDVEFIEVVNYFQKYSIGTLEPREVYKWYCNILPKGKRFNKYIKGKKEKKYDKELINTLVNYFKCSILHIEEYLDFLSKDELKIILSKYGFNSKEIKRMIK